MRDGAVVAAGVTTGGDGVVAAAGSRGLAGGVGTLTAVTTRGDRDRDRGVVTTTVAARGDGNGNGNIAAVVVVVTTTARARGDIGRLGGDTRLGGQIIDRADGDTDDHGLGGHLADLARAGRDTGGALGDGVGGGGVDGRGGVADGDGSGRGDGRDGSVGGLNLIDGADGGADDDGLGDDGSRAFGHVGSARGGRIGGGGVDGRGGHALGGRDGRVGEGSGGRVGGNDDDAAAAAGEAARGNGDGAGLGGGDDGRNGLGDGGRSACGGGGRDAGRVHGLGESEGAGAGDFAGGGLGGLGGAGSLDRARYLGAGSLDRARDLGAGSLDGRRRSLGAGGSSLLGGAGDLGARRNLLSSARRLSARRHFRRGCCSAGSQSAAGRGGRGSLGLLFELVDVDKGNLPVSILELLRVVVDPGAAVGIELGPAGRVPESRLTGGVTAEVEVEDDLHVLEGPLNIARVAADRELRLTPCLGLGLAVDDVLGLGTVGPAPDAETIFGPLGGVCIFRVLCEYGWCR